MYVFIILFNHKVPFFSNKNKFPFFLLLNSYCFIVLRKIYFYILCLIVNQNQLGQFKTKNEIKLVMLWQMIYVIQNIFEKIGLTTLSANKKNDS
jgi:hypothetical protein